jgi:hypothetical protein
MYSKILIPLDGSATAEKVLPYARIWPGSSSFLSLPSSKSSALQRSGDHVRHSASPVLIYPSQLIFGPGVKEKS